MLASELCFNAAAHRDSLQSLQEIDVEEGASKLAIRNASQADGLLLLNHSAYVLVFNLAQLLLGYAVLLIALAGIQ